MKWAYALLAAAAAAVVLVKTYPRTKDMIFDEWTGVETMDGPDEMEIEAEVYCASEQPTYFDTLPPDTVERADEASLPPRDKRCPFPGFHRVQVKRDSEGRNRHVWHQSFVGQHFFIGQRVGDDGTHEIVDPSTLEGTGLWIDSSVFSVIT